MANRILSPLLLLRLFNSAQVADSLDLSVDFLVAFLCNLIVDHVPLSFGILDSSQLLELPSCAHVQIGTIQVVFAHLVVVVKNGKLVMLLRFQ